MRALLLLTLSVALLSGLPACGGCNTAGQEALVYTDGVLSPDKTMYESTAPGEDMLHFPAGRVYHLAHGLGTSHIEILPYVSFVKQLVPGNPGSHPFSPNHISVAAGNEAVIEGWDDKYIRIRNDTCAEFYLYLVATTAPGYSGGGGVGGVSTP